jgi:SAM-dependent MidA family methyltransferase
MAASPDSLASSEERRTQLLGRAGAEAGADGFLPFDRWMELVLYADGLGYYTRPRTPLGPSGDFYTAPHVHPLFSAAFAERIHAVRSQLGADRPFTLVEVGPGDGTLLAGILDVLGPRWTNDPAVRIAVVERSSPLRTAALLRVRAAAAPFGLPIGPVDSVAALGPFEGVVLTNELLDAQPVRRLRWNGRAWSELGVRVHASGVIESERPLVGAVAPPPLPKSLPDGTVFEFSPAAEGLVREIADHLVAGVLMIDDYGMEEEELLRGHPGGTLATVRGHHSGTAPTSDPGEQDLSTFVNWTRLRAVAGAAGLSLVADRSQAEALGAWGFARSFDEAVGRATSTEAEVRLRLSVKNLLFGFERFRVLEFAPARSADRFRTST